MPAEAFPLRRVASACKYCPRMKQEIQAAAFQDTGLGNKQKLRWIKPAFKVESGLMAFLIFHLG